MREKSFLAVVQQVYPKGRHGPYAKARSEALGSITFSLDPKVWREKEWPEEGACVIMADVHRKRAGWRAQKCRLMRPEDKIASSTGTTATTDERKEANHG